MKDAICAACCAKCQAKDSCGGCVKTNGRPFGGACVLAVCCHQKGYTYCDECSASSCELKEKLIAQFNALGIADMPKVKELYALKGSFINLEYSLANGQVVKLLEDEKIYLGNQLCKNGSERCYGLATDGKYLLVCEYGEGGRDAEIVLYKRWKDDSCLS